MDGHAAHLLIPLSAPSAAAAGALLALLLLPWAPLLWARLRCWKVRTQKYLKLIPKTYPRNTQNLSQKYLKLIPKIPKTYPRPRLQDAPSARESTERHREAKE